MDRRSFLKTSSGVLVASGLLSRPATAASDTLKIGMLVPRSGPAGLYGPSSEACAELAVAQINAAGGIMGRKVEILFGDAGGTPSDTVQVAQRLWRREGVEILVGNHDSASREAVLAMLRGQLPYIYGAVTEGGYCEANLFNLATTPAQQLAPVIPYLAEVRGAKTYFLIGNDYIWPRRTNSAAKGFIEAAGGSVVGEEYYPFTVDNFDTALARIKDSGADAVLCTLVGGSSIAFNRAFASFGLDQQAIRLGTLFDEPTLEGIGAENTHDLYGTGGFFEALDTPAAMAFKKEYAAAFGADAPTLNMIGESPYEGLLAAKALVEAAGSTDVKDMAAASEGVSYDGPRGTVTLHGRFANADIYLAKAEGTAYGIVETFGNIGAGEACEA